MDPDRVGSYFEKKKNPKKILSFKKDLDHVRFQILKLRNFANDEI